VVEAEPGVRTLLTEVPELAGFRVAAESAPGAWAPPAVVVSARAEALPPARRAQAAVLTKSARLGSSSPPSGAGRVFPEE
jgi:hypothetical protein